MLNNLTQFSFFFCIIDRLETCLAKKQDLLKRFFFINLYLIVKLLFLYLWKLIIQELMNESMCIQNTKLRCFF